MDLKQKREVLDLLYQDEARAQAFLTVNSVSNWLHARGIKFEIDEEWLATMTMSDPDSTAKVPLIRIDSNAVMEACLAHAMALSLTRETTEQDKAQGKEKVGLTFKPVLSRQEKLDIIDKLEWSKAIVFYTVDAIKEHLRSNLAVKTDLIETEWLLSLFKVVPPEHWLMLDECSVQRERLMLRLSLKEKWIPNKNGDLFNAIDPLYKIEEGWSHVDKTKMERIQHLLRSNATHGISMGCRVAEPKCPICGETGPHVQHYSAKEIRAEAKRPNFGVSEVAKIVPITVEMEKWERMIAEGLGVTEHFLFPDKAKLVHQTHDSNTWEADAAKFEAVKAEIEKWREDKHFIPIVSVQRQRAVNPIYMCWRCGRAFGKEGVFRSCDCGGWVVGGWMDAAGWEQALAMFHSVEEALIEMRMAVRDEVTSLLMPRVVPIGFDVRIVSIRDDAMDRDEMEPYLGELATVELPLEFKLQIGTRLYYQGKLDPTRWSSARPRHFDHVEIKLVPGNKGMGNSVETQIVNILDEIDDRFTGSQFMGPDPLQIAAERARLALAEVEYAKIVETHEHEIRSVLEDMTGLPRLFEEVDRLPRWERAWQCWEYIEDVCDPPHARRTSAVLRAARTCLDAIKNLPIYRA